MLYKKSKTKSRSETVSIELLVGFLNPSFLDVKFLSILNEVPDRAATPNGLSSKLYKLFKNLFLSSVMKSSNVYFKHKPVKIELSSKVGIRSQMFDKNSKKLFNDFVVIKQNNIIHILNAISPAWTSSFAMAEFICEKYTIKK